jgi:hypothetical protein
MLHNIGAAELRRLAAEYFEKSNDPSLSGEQRDRCRRTYESFLALAASADWLAGRPGPEYASQNDSPNGSA